MLVVLIAFLSTGCQPAHVQEPMPAGWAADDSHGHTEFWYQLPNRAVVGNDEVFHGLLLYMDGSDACADYPARVALLKSRKLLPADFNEKANDVTDRGTLALALVRMLKIEGGVNMHLFGAIPRYAVRALIVRGVYPQCSPNQGISGGQFVGIMQKAEEYEHGNPADAPAAKLPSEILHQGGPIAAARAKQTPIPAAGEPAYADAIPPELFVAQPASLARSLTPPADPLYFDIVAPLCAPMSQPFFLDDASSAVPAPGAAVAPGAAKKLNIIITGVEGDSAEVRKSEADPWGRARVGMVVHDAAEFRTGAKSAIRFIIPPDQTFSLDSQGSIKVLDAIGTDKKVKTDVGLVRGRMRYDVAKIADTGAPVRIEQAGIEHDATIRSPNSALALRGTKVSLFDQPGFDPEAISLTGAAIYINTRGQRIPFGGTRRAEVSGARTSAAQQASDRTSAIQSPELSFQDFQNRETSILIQRGGLVYGDVVVGDLHLSDFHNHLPGALDFVLQWGPTAQSRINDLNLGVFSPLNSASKPDFVANPPYYYSLAPTDPANISLRAKLYPMTSPSGGSISKNSVGPYGLELASWPAKYPVGTYNIVVYDLVDSTSPPKTQTNPVTYTIEVFLNGRQVGATYTNTIGLLQTSGVTVNIPASTAGATNATATVPKTPKKRSTAKAAPRVPAPTKPVVQVHAKRS
jgi:hypothetical protein